MSNTRIFASFLAIGMLVGPIGGKPALLSAQSVLSSGVVANEHAIPQVPEIKVHISHSILENAPQQLDGFSCEDCTLKNIRWQYSGGAFEFKKSRISGPMRVEFSGAALNTLRLLAIMNALNPHFHVEPFDPTLRLANSVEGIVTITSSCGGTP